jgi:uncharacterized membrane protein YccC
MLTLLEQIHQELPQASELVLQEVWTILNLADNESEHPLTTESFIEDNAQAQSAGEADCAWYDVIWEEALR